MPSWLINKRRSVYDPYVNVTTAVEERQENLQECEDRPSA